MKVGFKRYEFGIVPNSWNIKRIGDIFGDLKTGATPSRSNSQYFEGNIPWITSGELKQKVIYKTNENITKEAVRDTNLRIYPKGTFFIAITGLEAEGTRGSCAMNGMEAATNQSCLAFQEKGEILNEYLYYWYLLYGDYIGIKYTQGTKQQSLNNKIVEELELAFPVLDEQRKIVEVLSTVDAQIDDTDKFIEKTRELKKGLMQRLLTKGIGHTEFKKIEFGEVPVEWKIKKLGELYEDLKTGSTPSRTKPEYFKGNIPWITSGELKRKFISKTNEYITEEAIKDTNLKIYPKGTFFIAITGLEAAGTRGSCGISAVEATTNQSCMAFQEKSELLNEFLYYWYMLYGNYIGIKYTQGTKQQSLNNKIVEDLEIGVPSIKEQHEIIDILSSIDGEIEEYEKKKGRLEELKEGLMQQLLTGKLRVE